MRIKRSYTGFKFKECAISLESCFWLMKDEGMTGGTCTPTVGLKLK